MAWLVAYVACVNVCHKSMANFVCFGMFEVCSGVFVLCSVSGIVCSKLAVYVCVRLFGAHLWGHECANGFYV